MIQNTNTQTHACTHILVELQQNYKTILTIIFPMKNTHLTFSVCILFFKNAFLDQLNWFHDFLVCSLKTAAI